MRTSGSKWHWLLALGIGGAVLAGAANAQDTVTYVYADAQGTPLAEADGTGTITARYDYTPYGTAVTGSGMSGAPNGPGYTGHVNDPDTGLVYMQARYYDPAVGRFLTVDPDEKSTVTGLSITNRYTYANNNSNRYIDPDGRQALEILAESPTLRVGTRISPLTEAVRQGIRSPVPRTAQEQAEQLAREAGLKPGIPPSQWKTETKEPWIPTDMSHFGHWDDAPDVVRLLWHVARVLVSGHPSVTVGPLLPVDPNHPESKDDKSTTPPQPTSQPPPPPDPLPCVPYRPCIA